MRPAVHSTTFVTAILSEAKYLGIWHYPGGQVSERPPIKWTCR